MNKELSNYYLIKAIQLANSNNLTKAIRYASIAIGLDKENNKSRRLAGLCYYKLGNYEMSKYCFGSLATEKLLDELEKKIQAKNSRQSMIEKNEYKKEILKLENQKYKSLNDYNYLGCLYAITSQKNKAVECFVYVLNEDTENVYALKYLKNVNQIKTKRWFVR